MAPRNKFTREEMIKTATEVVRERGYTALTAQSIADVLGTSTRPIFTCFETMEEVKKEVYTAALKVYDSYAEEGLKEKIPFFGVGMQYIRFAKEEAELYRLLFLAPDGKNYSAMKAMRHLQELVRPTLVSVYHITGKEADLYFRNLWLVVHSLATLIVTGDCPYSDREIGQILTGFSVSICKAIKEIPGFAKGTFDRDAVFGSLIGENQHE